MLEKRVVALLETRRNERMAQLRPLVGRWQRWEAIMEGTRGATNRVDT